jgi:hypothetical protein
MRAVVRAPIPQAGEACRAFARGGIAGRAVVAI